MRCVSWHMQYTGKVFAV